MRHAEKPELPDFMYLVTEERVRQGKCPIRFQPICYDFAGAFIRAPSTYHDGVSRKFPTEHCYSNIQEALSVTERMANDIAQREQEKLERLKNRLAKSVDSTRKMALNTADMS